MTPTEASIREIADPNVVEKCLLEVDNSKLREITDLVLSLSIRFDPVYGFVGADNSSISLGMFDKSLNERYVVLRLSGVEVARWGYVLTPAFVQVVERALHEIKHRSIIDTLRKAIG